MKILFDTNVVLDILGKTEDFFASYASYDVVLSKKFDPYIAVKSVTDVVYLLSARKHLRKAEARGMVEPLLEMFEVLDSTAADCVQADKSEMSDFEDALIAYSARRHNIDFIVTRNKKDFLKSSVAALTPAEFLNIYKPDYLEYELEDF